MKLATFIDPVTTQDRVGVLLRIDGVEHVADAALAASVPSDMVRLLEAGDAALAALRDAVTRGANGRLKRISHPLAGLRVLAPIPRPPKIVAIGANYEDHIREGRASGALDMPLPPYPPAFLKMSTAVLGPGAPIVYPHLGQELDYEVEFAIVIGKRCQDIAPEAWLDVIAGYTIVNDLSLRDVILQEKASGNVLVGKNFAGACPLGPYLVTKDEIADPDDLRLQLRVNGTTRQDGRTSDMIHDCATVVSFWSKLGFEPGDVITTGTPGGGAGFGRRHPERLLQPGDRIEAEIEGIGILHNTVVGAAQTAEAAHAREAGDITRSRSRYA